MAENGSINTQTDVIQQDDGLSCLKYGLRVKYQQFQREQTASGVKTTIVLQGSYEACKKAMEGDGSGITPEFSINHSHPTYGNLESMRLNQDEGPLWALELVYTTEINWLGQSTSKGSTYGKTSSELNCRMLSVPLEQHPDYEKRWNYTLYSNVPDVKSKLAPDAWAWIVDAWKDCDAQHDFLSGFAYSSESEQKDFYLAWSKPDITPTTMVNEKPTAWIQILPCTKPRSRIL